jgi:cell division initiation protein
VTVMTPLDLPAQQFKSSVRGFDRREVLEFVTELAADYEEALREADRLRDDLGRTQALVEEHREQERNLRATLMTAQKLADEIRNTAEQESQRIIAEAQARAADLLQATAPRLEALEREIARLRQQREQAASENESTIATLRATLDRVSMGAAVT